MKNLKNPKGLIILFIIFFLQFSLNGNAQSTLTKSWESKMGDPNVNYFELKAEFDAYWKDREIGKGQGYKPFMRWAHFIEGRVDQNGKYDPFARQRELKKYKATHGHDRSSAANDWVVLGPIGDPSGGNGVGRINVMTEHPTNSNILFIGTPAGGLWKSINSGSSWTTNTDNLDVLGVSDIVFDPIDPDIMYIVSGDRDHNDNSTVGIFKSTDGGDNWVLTNFQPGLNGLPDFYLIHRLLVDPANGNTMVTSTTDGVFRSTDGGTSWTSVDANNCMRHMQYHPTNSNIIYGTTSGSYCGGLNSLATFFRSTNGGSTWTQVTVPNTTDIERMAIGISESIPNNVYLLASYNDAGGSNDFRGLYKSTNSGVSFSNVTVTVPPALGSQQWYDWSFTVSPTNDNILFAGGVGFRKSTNGGTTWASNGSGVHVDHHFAKYFGNRLYACSDGGIYRSTNDGSTWTNINGNLEIGQYYRISSSPTDINLVMAGAQDNGTHKLDNGTWVKENGGDGMDNAIDPQDETKLYLSSQYGNFRRSTNSGGTWTTMINSGTTGVSGAWVTPIKIDPSNPSVIYTGYDRIWKSTNSGVTWSDIGGGQLTSSTLRYIDVANSNSNVIYTISTSILWKSTNGGTSWTVTNDPGGFLTWIEIDPTDEDHLFIAASNDIYESTNGGTSWSNISGTLPNISINTVVYDIGTNDGIYVGTDLGVYYTDANMTDWIPFNDNLPNVVVLELDIQEATDKLRAGTFGRGIWEAPLLSAAPCSIDAIADAGIKTCVGSTYTRDIVVTYTGAPATGDLVVLGQNFPFTGSPQTVTLSGLPLDGQSVNVEAHFTAEPACSLTANNLYSNPSSCPCIMVSINSKIETCDGNGTIPNTDDIYTFSVNPTAQNSAGTYSVSGDVSASGLSYGVPTIFDNGGNGFAISAGNMSITVTDDVTGTCSLTETVIAPTNCSSNYTCSSASILTSSGTYTTIGPSQGAGGSQAGYDANWYVFAPTTSGSISVASCGYGVDTRLFIHQGDCNDYVLIASNDDFCEMGAGQNNYASQLLNICVDAGTTYYIEWDNRWSPSAFDFDFTFTTQAQTPTLVNTFPYDESFESGNHSWIDVFCSDDQEWTRKTGSTTSSNTGPSAAADGLYYMYTEASNNFNNVTILQSPYLDFTNEVEPVLTFNYHMYGLDMGTLSLEITNDNGATWTELFTQTGDQGDQWFIETIDLNMYSGQEVQLQFVGAIGTSFTSDMSIDDINIVVSDCSTSSILTLNTNPIPNGIYSAGILNSAGVIPNLGDVQFRAFDINLMNEFSVELGGLLNITNDPCGSIIPPASNVTK